MRHDSLVSHAATKAGFLCLLLSSLLLPGFFSPSAFSDQGSASISLSPEEGEVGSSITIDGSGFGAQALVTIEFAGDEIPTDPADISADDQGDFTAEITVPDYTSEGIIEITASDNSVTAFSDFTVINTPPVADSQPTIQVEQGDSELVSLTASDINGDSLTIEIVDDPLHGLLSDFDSDTGEVIYTADSDYAGPDSFSFKVNDGIDDSDTTTIDISVTAELSGDVEVDTLEDVAVTVPLDVADTGWETVNFAIMDEPQHGTLGEIEYTGENAAQVSYDPDNDYAGTDTFVFSANSDSDSITKTVVISVEGVNDAPVAIAGSSTVIENSREKITLGATDVDGDHLSYAIISDPSHGVLSGTAPDLYYVPADGYLGSDSFTFSVSDSEFESDPVEFAITVVEKGTSGTYHYDDESEHYTNRPVANAQSVSGTEDEPLRITLTATDPDNDPISYSITSYPEHGQLAGFNWTTGVLTYLPDPEFSGDDSFTFAATDGYKESKEALVSITLIAVNDPPQPVSLNITAIDGKTNVTLEAFDAEGDPLDFAVYSTPSNGTLSGNGTSFLYTADNGFAGYDMFLFTVTDGRPDARIGVISIFVGVDDLESGEPQPDDTEAPSNSPNDVPDIPPSDEPADDEGTDDSGLTTTKARADKSRVMVMLDWDHHDLEKHVESTLHLQFAEVRTRTAFDSDVWYDLVMLDGNDNEVFRRNDLVATNSQDTQNVTFPSDGTYHFEVNVKGLIDRTTHSISRNADYTGKALGIVVVPEFSPALLAGVAAAMIGSMIVVLRYRGFSR